MSKNNESMGPFFVVSLLLGAILTVGLVIAGIAIGVTIGFSVICGVALFRPVTIGGETIYADEARVFFLGGIVGAFLFPLPLAFLIAALYKFYEPIPQYGVLLAAGGYTIGAWLFIVVRGRIVEADLSATAFATAPPVEPTVKAGTPEAPPRVAFQFATWDDEEHR